MSTFITHGATTITPTVVSSYEVEQEGGNLVHTIPGRSEPDVTLRPAGLRTGTLTLTFASATAANAARLLHVTGGVFTLTSPEQAVVNMSYVLSGKLGTVLGSAGEWTITVDFHEVSP